jgi:hypothetical protein
MAFLRYNQRGAQLVSWCIVRQSGAVFYVIPGYPGAGPEGLVLAEGQANVGP